MKYFNRDRKHLMGPVASGLLVTLASLIVAAIAYGTSGTTATVDLSTLMVNPSFEFPNQPIAPGNQVGCPAGWTCLGSPAPGGTTDMVTNLQYMPGMDGLMGGLIVPDGMYAGQCPTLVAGSCQLYQLGLGMYAANTIYTLNLWVGTPLTVPNCGTAPQCTSNVTPAGKVARGTFYWLGNGNGQLQATNIPVPAPGQWLLVPLTFRPTGNQVGQPINILIFASTGAGHEIINFDIVAPPTGLGSNTNKLRRLLSASLAPAGSTNWM